MIKITNDTTTLNGSLSQLGETLASNITSKGVSASASDGLTTLANKVLQITGGGGGSTTLFEDKCDSSSGLTNYGSSVLIRGSNATITMTYDSTENAYKLSGSGNYHAMIPIPTLDDEDEYTITANVKGQNIRYNGIGFYLDNRSDTTSFGQAFWLEVYGGKLAGRQYKVSADGTENSATGLSLSGNTWYKLEMTIIDSILFAKLYDSGGTQLASTSSTLSVSNRQMGIFLMCETGSTNSVCYIKNIKAETLGGGGGGPTTLFEDKCDSSSGLSNYGSIHRLRLSTKGDGALSYDSTKNAYKFSPSNVDADGFCDIPILSLDNKDKYTIEVEFFTDDSSNTGQTGLTLYPVTDTGGNGVLFRDIASINRCGVLNFANYTYANESGNSQQSSLPVYNNWYKLKLEIDGTDVVAKWQQTDGTTVYSTNYTVPYTASQMRVGLTFLSANTSKYYYVRNIKAESLGGGSDCSQYTTQINNAIEYINGSGS